MTIIGEVSLTVAVSIISSVAAVGISFGIWKTKIQHIALDLNKLAERLDKEIGNIKTEYIEQMRNRMKEDEDRLRDQRNLLTRLEEQIKSLNKIIEQKFATVTDKLENLK